MARHYIKKACYTFSKQDCHAAYLVTRQPIWKRHSSTPDTPRL